MGKEGWRERMRKWRVSAWEWSTGSTQPLAAVRLLQGAPDAWSEVERHGDRVSPKGPSIKHLVRVEVDKFEPHFGIFRLDSDLSA
jgi:hypothetical protein